MTLRDPRRRDTTDGMKRNADGPAYTVTCSGVLGSSSFDSVQESEVATVTSGR
jgi:hypothetical protein